MRKIIIAISCCIVLLLLGFAGYRGYKIWKERHLVSLARTFAESGDVRNEHISLQQVLAVNPRNVEACRRMAALAEAARSPETLIWRQRVVDLAPDSTEDRLALVQTAIQMGDMAFATNALAGVSDEGKKTAIYHNVAGMLAALTNHRAEAEMHFSEALRLEPANPALQINLSVVRLHGTNPLDAASARVDLKRVSMNPTNATTRLLAMRELLKDALQSKDAAASLSLSAEVVSLTNATFNDKLLRLDVLRTQQQPDLAPTIAAYQREAGTNFAKLAEMADWMMKRTTTTAALKWLQSLPAETQTNQPANMLIAECQLKESNWLALGNSLKSQNWNEMDFMRHAMLSRALREQNNTASSTAEWEVTLKLAGEQKIRLIALFRLAALWSWINEAEQILWTIVNRYPEEKWAGEALQQALVLGGRTRPLMQYLSLQAKRTPHNLLVLNDLAMTAMLLDAQEIAPHDLAQKVYEKDPKNLASASTYAFALYQQKKYSQAIEVLQKLGPEALNNPSLGGYYGLILKATGENSKAEPYLKAAISKGLLLPEERKMFEEALKK